MPRKNTKKALYEVIGKGRFKSGCDKSLESLNPERTGLDVTDSKGLGTEYQRLWPKKPRILQFNAGRIELSLPYPLATAVILGLVLLVLVAFRLGQKDQRAIDALVKTPDFAQTDAVNAAVESSKNTVSEKNIYSNAEKIGQDGLKGDHRIVITQYHRQRDLIPVQRHFAAFGIGTVIEKRQNRFFLVTKDTYSNPQRAGTDGAEAKKKIREVGAQYKAATGFERFALRLFSDAYGEKIK